MVQNVMSVPLFTGRVDTRFSLFPTELAGLTRFPPTPEHFPCLYKSYVLKLF